ncbi:MAG: hypothetical protein ACLPX9_20665 [Rhodomicrobium sp.]
MEPLEQMSRSLLEVLSHNILIVVAVVVILIGLRTLFGRYITVIKDEYTYIMYNVDGFSRTLYSSGFYLNPVEWVLKGKDAPDLSFSVYDKDGKKTSTTGLLDKKTGKVDLRQQQLRYPFEASSADHHKLSGFVDVQFRLDQHAIGDTIKIAGFGNILENSVLSALREKLGEYQDSNIRKNLKSLQASALDRLKEKTNDENGDDAFDSGRTRQGNLGVIFLGLTCHIDPAKGSGHGSEHGEADKTASDTAMSFFERDIFLIRKEFLGEQAAQGEALQMANNAVLQILEMHTRQKIAQALGRSGNLVILSADELGVSGNMVLWEKMRAMMGNAAAGKHDADGDGPPAGPSSDGAGQPLTRKA